MTNELACEAMAKRLREYEAELQRLILYNDGAASWESAGHLRNRMRGRLIDIASRLGQEANLLHAKE